MFCFVGFVVFGLGMGWVFGFFGGFFFLGMGFGFFGGLGGLVVGLIGLGFIIVLVCFQWLGVLVFFFDLFKKRVFCLVGYVGMIVIYG